MLVMPDDNQTQDAITPVVPANPPEDAESSETTEIPNSAISDQPDGSKPSDLPPEAPESSINAPSNVPVEDQNQGLKQSESKSVEPSKEPEMTESSPVTPAQPAPAPQTSAAPQSQSLAQQDQVGFIRSLLAKAQAKIQSNKQKKLDKIIQFAQKKKIVANEDIQLLLHVSSATATRYLVKLVEQSRLARVGNPRDAKYQFLR